MTYGEHTYGGASVGSTTVTPERDRSATYRVTRDGDVIEDAVFDVDPLVETANPYGNFCVIKMDDRGGAKFEDYERGTRVDVAISEGYDDPFEDRFTGYVVERRETEQQGADVLEVEAYSFDQFLRRNTVTNDQTGNTITQALADIIQTDTPVTYAPANVDVGDDQELTRGYQGEAVENVLRDLAFKSNNEDFGVNDSLEFFFRERETVHINRGIDNTQWFNYDIPELGKEAINEVEVWFNDGEESVIVDDGTDKLDLQDSLGLPDPGTQRAERNRPLLTDINDAEDEGRKYLAFRNATLSGTVTTFGLFDAEPGDTIDITIDPRGIDTEFVIAAVEYRWGRDETILTIVEKRGDVDDILSELNDSVQRVEMEGANRDAPSNRITTTDAGAIVSHELGFSASDSGVVSNGIDTPYTTAVTGEYNAEITCTLTNGESATVTVEVRKDGVLVDSAQDSGTAPAPTGFLELSASLSGTAEFDTIRFEHSGDSTGEWDFTVSNGDFGESGRFVNNGRRAVRDAWTGDGTPDVTTLVVGDDGTGLSRSNTALNTQTNSASVTQTLPDATSVAFEATITQTGVREIGLETAAGTLITRAVFADPVDIDGTVTVTLDVSNDASVSRGVLTDDGQTAVRDVLADNNPTLPNAYAYGSDNTAVGETDTALGNELVDVSLEDVLIQSADTETQWDAIVDTAADAPIRSAGGFLEDTQICATREGENGDNTNSTGLVSDSAYSGGSAVEFPIIGDGFVEWLVTFDHDIAAADVGVQVRDEVVGANSGARWIFNGVTLDEVTGSGKNLGWTDLSEGGFYNTGFGAYDAQDGGDLQAGETYTLRLEVRDGEDASDYHTDVVAVYDQSRESELTFDDSVDANGYLTGPQEYPLNIQTALATASTRRNVTEARFDLTANDVSNNFWVELANDGSTYTRVDNSQTGSVTFASPERGVDTTINLSRWGSRTTATPTEGFNPQQIDVWELYANPDAVVPDNIGETLSRAVVAPGTLADGTTVREAGLKSDSTLLTRHVLAEFDVLADQRIASAETTRFTGED